MDDNQLALEASLRTRTEYRTWVVPTNLAAAFLVKYQNHYVGPIASFLVTSKEATHEH
jgi:hypothetical protein